jgi:hypothetical protein
MAAADNHGLLAGSSLSAAAAAGNGGFGGGSSSGLVQGPGNQAAAATAGGVPGMLPRGGGGNGGGRLSPFEGSTAVNTAVMAAAATAGDYGTAGESQHTAPAQDCIAINTTNTNLHLHITYCSMSHRNLP